MAGGWDGRARAGSGGLTARRGCAGMESVGLGFGARGRGDNSLNVPHDEHSDWPLRFREFQPKLMGQVKSSLRLRLLTQCGIVVGPFQTGPVDYRNVKQPLEGASDILRLDLAAFQQDLAEPHVTEIGRTSW